MTPMLEPERLRFSREVLGPIFYDYCHRLHTYFLSYDDRKTTFLFCARAGLRLKYLYELFLEAQSLSRPLNPLSLFWISRFMTAKGLYTRCPNTSFDLIAKQFNHTTVKNMLPCLLPEHVIAQQDLDISLEFDFQLLHSIPSTALVQRIFQSNGEFGAVLRDHYTNQAQLFESQILKLLNSASLGVLVDSGWNATTQKLLMEGYPEIDWHGLYCGRFGDKQANNWHLFNVMGLMVEAYNYDLKVPASCIHHHHHIIEDLLEPGSPSVEYLRYDKDVDSILPDPVYTSFDYHTPGQTEQHYQGVVEYFQQINQRQSIYEIREQSRSAWQILHDKICFPTQSDIDLIDVRERSADFGKIEKNPILIRHARTPEERDPEVRLQHALWKQGQIALDYPEQAKQKQAELIGVSEKNKDDVQSSSKTDVPSVAIITRTKNRPVMLKRAGLSVASQTFQDFVWVVVNDGGDPKEVNQIVRNSPVDLRKVLIVHNEKSLGMEAASNKGIESSQSKYIVIHDDDDSWQPQFLEKTVAFLDNPPVASMKGVIAHANRLSEYIVDDSYVEVIDSVPYQDWVMTVPLYEMASMNMFAPISFLFSREICSRIKGFDETLPVLGDWDFNLRFLMECDIGVIPEKLANYHHRDFQKSGSYSNSVFGAISKHQMYEAIVRNKGVRNVGENQGLTMTSLLGQGRADYDIRAMLQAALDRL